MAPIENTFGNPAAATITPVVFRGPSVRVRTIVDAPHIHVRRAKPPTSQGSPDEMVSLVDSDQGAITRFKAEGSPGPKGRKVRLHDADTLLGAMVYVFGIQSYDWAWRKQIAETVISDALVIAWSKFRRASEAGGGAKVVISEALVYNILRGALRHRSSGDGRTISTESAQAREELDRRMERISSAVGYTYGREVRARLAREVRDSYPAGRRPTLGFELTWREAPKDPTPHPMSSAEGAPYGHHLESILGEYPSAEDTALESSDISAIVKWQDSDPGGQITETAINSYVRAVLHAGAPRLVKPRRGRKGKAMEIAESASKDAASARELIGSLGDGSALDEEFDLSDRSAIERLRELAGLCSDAEVMKLAKGMRAVLRHPSRFPGAVAP